MSRENIIDLLATRRARSKAPEVWSVMPDSAQSGDEEMISALIVNINDPRHNEIVAASRDAGRLVLTASDDGLAYITAIVMASTAEIYNLSIDDTVLSVAGDLPDWRYEDVLSHLKGVNAMLEVLYVLDQDPEEEKKI